MWSSPRTTLYLNVNVAAALDAQRRRRSVGGRHGWPGRHCTQRPDDFPTWFGWWVNSPPPAANPVGSLTGLCAHLRTSWEWRYTSNMILVHYRNLELHLESELRRIADALGITVDETTSASLVRAAEFEAMRSLADELVPEVHVPGHWHDNQEFFNTGTSGQWRTLLTDADLTAPLESHRP